MLEFAYFNEAELQNNYSKFLQNEKAKFALPFPLQYKILIDDSNLSLIQVVSKNEKNRIVGFIEAQIDRYNNFVENVFLIKFCENNSFLFVKDTIKFFSDLFIVHGFSKIVFQVIEKNPANHIFERFIKEKEVGRKVGVLKKHRKNISGDDFDVVIYEVYNNLWIKEMLKQEALL